MTIQSVEVICIPCPKCEGLEQKIRSMIDNVGIINKIKIVFEFKHTAKLEVISQYALSPAQTPVILINGQVEMAGKIDPILLRRRLEALQKSC